MIPKDTHIMFTPKNQCARRISLSDSTIRRELGKNTEAVIKKAKSMTEDKCIMKFRVMGTVEIHIK